MRELAKYAKKLDQAVSIPNDWEVKEVILNKELYFRDCFKPTIVFPSKQQH